MSIGQGSKVLNTKNFKRPKGLKDLKVQKNNWLDGPKGPKNQKA